MAVWAVQNRFPGSGTGTGSGGTDAAGHGLPPGLAGIGHLPGTSDHQRVFRRHFAPGYSRAYRRRRQGPASPGPDGTIISAGAVRITPRSQQCPSPGGGSSGQRAGCIAVDRGRRDRSFRAPDGADMGGPMAPRTAAGSLGSLRCGGWRAPVSCFSGAGADSQKDLEETFRQTLDIPIFPC